jgi:hypothetical protein
MSRWVARAAASLLALAALVSIVVGSTVSTTITPYADTAATVSNTFSAAADSVAPTASVGAIGRSGAYDTGFIKQAANYYVYATVGDTGNPASGIASVTADVHTINAGATAIAMTPGSYTAGGTAYNYRSAVRTAATPLAAGSDAYTITATDSAGNTGTQSFSTVIDNTPPTASDVQSTNVSGGTVGHLDQGDTLKLTYSATMDPYSILAGWTGAATNVQVALVDGGGTSPDSLYVYDTAASPAQIPVGIVTLGTGSYLGTGAGSYIVYGATGAATPSTMTRSGSLITIVLGTPNGSSLTNATASAMTWTPTTSATDIAGNPVTATAATQSGTVHKNF